MGFGIMEVAGALPEWFYGEEERWGHRFDDRLRERCCLSVFGLL